MQRSGDVGAEALGVIPFKPSQKIKVRIFMAVADLVIVHRARHGITQQELASRMGTSVAAISRLESGFHLPSLDTTRKVAAAIGGRVKIEIVDIPPIPPIGRKKRTTTTKP